MREEFTIAAPAGMYARLLEGNTLPDSFVQQLFSDTANFAVLKRALEAYHNKDGGSPEAQNIELIDVKFNPATRSGSFRCRFKLHFHYTCSDVHNHAADTISWDFKLSDDDTILFKGEIPWTRDAE